MFMRTDASKRSVLSCCNLRGRVKMKSRIKSILLTGAILSSAFSFKAASAEITVSPEGVSPKEALEKIRARRINATPSTFSSSLAQARQICANGGKVVLRLSPGDYFLASPIELGANDSYLTIESAVPRKARIIRGKKIEPGSVVDCVPE